MYRRRHPCAPPRVRGRTLATRAGLLSVFGWCDTAFSAPWALLVKPHARRRIRAVNVGVTGEAASSHDAFIRVRTGSQGLPRLQVVRVQEIGMALLAEERNRRDQQRALIPAVRRVAIEAVLHNAP